MNNITNRTELSLLLLEWLRPLKRHYSDGCAWLNLGHSGAPYGQRDAWMEGYARILWGIGPLVSQSTKDLPEEAQEEIRFWIETARQGLIHGTDPENEEYWLDLVDNDHKMVEMPPIACAILLAPQHFWLTLSQREKENVVRWFDQINQRNVRGNNWICFRIIVNMMFAQLGLPYHPEIMEKDILTFEANYEDCGWYHDGRVEHKDYYIPFAMHFYSLIFAHFMDEKMPEYALVLRNRAKEFYKDFIYWFDDRGRSVPFGRSLTYRFAHTAGLAAMAFGGADISLGELKFLILQNLRYWSQQPIFDNEGVLTIGYRYPNLIMSEMYNAPGSPYWALKTFLILAIPQSHAFWQVEEQKPEWKTRRWLKQADMLAVHNEGQAILYPAGHCAPPAGNACAKYQKFAYSSEFGFSVSRGDSLPEGAFDCTLAASEADDGAWRMRKSVTGFEVSDKCTKAWYDILPGVHVKSVIIPLQHGHIRVHTVQTNRPVDLADGGFAIAKEVGMHDGKAYPERIDQNSVHCDFPWGNAGAVSLDGTGKPALIAVFPNTNLMNNHTVIPTIQCSVSEGCHRIVNYFYGAGQERLTHPMPKIQLEENCIIIHDYENAAYQIEL